MSQETVPSPIQQKDAGTGTHTDPRDQELEKNAQIAYQQVPTQEELLKGDAKKPKTDAPVQTPPQAAQKSDQGADKEDSKELDEALADAASDSNIGGG